MSGRRDKPKLIEQFRRDQVRELRIVDVGQESARLIEAASRIAFSVEANRSTRAARPLAPSRGQRSS